MKQVLILMLIGCISAFAETEWLLWDGDMPGIGAEEPEGPYPREEKNIILLTNVSVPMLTFYPAENTETANPVVIICPGGGYNLLAYDLEGSEIAEWLNSIGVSAALLKYRVPENREGALADAQRAVRMVRENSKEWNIDPERVGMIGFSAGGHLTAACSNATDRPDFSILIYPAYLYKKGGLELTDDFSVSGDTPPAFLVHTQDDRKHYHSSLAYATALDAKGVSVELHLFVKGGHGYGLRPSPNPVSQWPSLCEQWMKSKGILNGSTCLTE